MRVGVLAPLVVLIVLAGCSAFGGGQATPTVTPADVPPEPTPENASQHSVAPGISPGNLTDVDHLADRHVDAIANASYAWNETQREYRPGGDGERVAVESRTHVERNETAFHRRTEYFGASPSRSGQYTYRLAEYGDGHVAYTMWLSSREGEPEFRRPDETALAPDHNLTVAESIRTYLDLEDVTVSRVDVGQRDHVLVSGTLEEHASYGPVEEYRARAIVREDGFVRRLTANFTVTVDDRPIPVEYRFAYSDIGTAEVTPPDWLDEARSHLGTDATATDGTRTDGERIGG